MERLFRERLSKNLKSAINHLLHTQAHRPRRLASVIRINGEYEKEYVVPLIQKAQPNIAVWLQTKDRSRSKSMRLHVFLLCDPEIKRNLPNPHDDMIHIIS